MKKTTLTNMDQLSAYGWNAAVHEAWDASAIVDTQPARVIADYGTSLTVVTVSGDEAAPLPIRLAAELAGKLAHHSSNQLIPKIGDWVALRVSPTGRAVVEVAVPRRNEIARKAAGSKTTKQIIAANVDVAFVILALDADFSIEQLQRYLYQLSQTSIQPVIVLNKADKTADVRAYESQLSSLGLPVIISVATEGIGAADILGHIDPGKTAVLLGSSGVGKSTLTNQLLGREAQRTQVVRERDDTGKHTTVHRELFVLPNGGLLIDTPGIRELQLWGSEAVLQDTFDDVTSLVSRCQFVNCTHGAEPACAVRASLASGELDPKRYASYCKMQRELVGLKQRNDVRSRLNNQRSRRSIQRQDRDRRQDDDSF